ncbi:MAG: DUF6265 family protein [Bacteroidota bacterium]
MKIKTTICLLSALLLTIPILISANQSNQVQISKIPTWLIGTWENKMKGGSIYETWKSESTFALSGKSYMLNNTDTTVLETISLIEENNTLFFIPTVMNQNDQKPIRFTLIENTDQQLTFENKSHDFPQLITYRLIHSDSLVAEISGEQDGQMKASRFAMTRL